MQNRRLRINILKLPSKVFYQLIRFSAKHLELIVISFLILLAAVQYYVRPQSQSLLEIQSSGVMRVLISDDPDSHYIFNKQHYGFEYEMLSRFAAQNDLKLELKIVPFAELFSLLDGGAGDVAVGGILSNNYIKRVGMPTIPWYQAKTTVVYKRGSDKPENLEELSLQGVKASARYYGIEGFDELNLIDDHRTEYELLSAVASGTERFAITTNYRANNAKHYLPNLNRSFILPNRVDLVWVLPRVHDVGLLNHLNEFLQASVADDVPNKLAKSYFALPRKITTYDALSIHKKIDKVLPEFEFAFRKAARRGRIDWPLLAAVSYQESKWSNSARSPTGVRGIMQLTESTARSLGVDDRMDMTQSIDAAAAYINQLRARLPKKIKEPERTWFAVGAYNVGYRHVLNAYKKARELGLDRTKWKTISNLLPNLYGVPFAQGVQAQHYVERIQVFTDILRFYDLHQRDEIEFKPVIGVVKDVAVSAE
ncbi:MAG: membrane-bound lytic murein transglycosylase F [Arenicella sp.]|jgi:membrane-bound lytic murein transglycosylase F